MSLKFLSTFLFLSLFAFSVSAQENTDETKTTSEQSEGSTEASVPAESSSSSSAGAGVEKIEVTGSHIKRIDVEGPSPVLTLDQEYLDKAGYNSVSDVLRDLPISSNGGVRETALSGQGQTGAGFTSLRGFGSDSILVLLDGKRLPALGGSSAVDLNLVPKAAVQRIEILKDGASATYGSDALGGVINIITKKDLDGGSIELGYTMPEEAGGTRTDVKGAYGFSTSKWNFLGVLQYRNNEETLSKDRYFSRVNDVSEMSTRSSPGSWRENNGSSPGAWNAGSPADPCPADRNLSNVCHFDYSQFSQITPKIEQYSTLLTSKWEVNESLSHYARLVFTRREVTNKLAPPPDTFRDDTKLNSQDYRIPQASAAGWSLAPAPGQPIDVFYRLVEEAGPRVSKIDSNAYSVQTGFNGFLFDSWEWEASGNYGVNNTTDRGVSGYANKQLLYDAILANPASFNPFAAPGSKSDLSFAKYVPVQNIDSSIGGVEVKAFGEVFDMPAGPVAMAVGASANWQTYEQSVDSVTKARQQWGGGTDATGIGHRDFQSAYAELSIPPFAGMEVQLAGRFDQYNDFGSTVNPKVAFRYKPISTILFRGSWGTGFKAPTLQQLYEGQTIGFPFGQDIVNNETSARQFVTIGSGNANLKEETSDSFNVGAVVEPARSLSFGVDYWRTKVENQVNNSQLRDIFLAENDPAFGPSYLNSIGITVNRDGTNTATSIINPYLNLSEVRYSGLDLRLQYAPYLWKNVRLNFLVEHSINFEVLTEPLPGRPKEDRIGFAGNPYWRNSVTLGVSTQAHDARIVARTTGEQNKNALSPTPGDFGKTRDHTEFDLRYQFNGSWGGSIGIGVRNVLGTKRPELLNYLSNGRIMTSLYDPFGRTFLATYTHSF